MIFFVADNFLEQYPGGSEQSFQALIDSCPTEYKTINSDKLNLAEISKSDFLILGNCVNFNDNNLKEITEYKFVKITSDFEYCRLRSPQLHSIKIGCNCDCIKTHPRAELVFDLLLASQCNFWKSGEQLKTHIKNFIPLTEVVNIVLSATFSDEDLNLMLDLRDIPKNNKYAVYNSKNIVKDYDTNLDNCRKSNLDCEGIGDLPRKEFLMKLAGYGYIFYYPLVEETCSRFTCEGKILGCKLDLGDFCLHKNEKWFSGDWLETFNYLRGRKYVFWNIVEDLL